MIKPSHCQQGFTLIELLVTIAIMAFLALASAPFAIGWVHSAHVNEAKSKLIQAYGLTKAMALRNPERIAGPGSAAAGIKLSGGKVLVCSKDSAAGACAIGAIPNTIKWQVDLPDGVTVKIQGTSTPWIGVDVDSSGLAVGATGIQVSKGNESESFALR